YFSMKVSHAPDHPAVLECRAALRARSVEDGLLWCMRSKGFEDSAAIQRSWGVSGERLIRYEDLLEKDEEVLVRLLQWECGLPIEEERLRSIIRANRFESLTGRPRGQEDVTSHERKGVAGDWRNYFTDRVKRAFKARFGDLLVATGYKKGLDW